jgi:hypothetical protein
LRIVVSPAPQTDGAAAETRAEVRIEVRIDAGAAPT